MSRPISQPCINEVQIVGTLLDVSTHAGVSKNGNQYESAKSTIRVTQKYTGIEETSEIVVDSFAVALKKDGKPNPAFNAVQTLKTFKTGQAFSYENADKVGFFTAQLAENSYYKNNTLRTTTVFNSAFSRLAPKIPPIACFKVEVYVMGIDEEMDKEGTPTGRCVITGALVQYGEKLDKITLIVEDPTYATDALRTISQGQTVLFEGRIRSCSKEVERKSEGLWGESSVTSTTTVRELIVTRCGRILEEDDENGYAREDISKLLAKRRADLEQKQIEAQEREKRGAKAQQKSVADWDNGF